MWVIIKFDKKNLNFLKLDIEKKMGNGSEFYLPKILYKRFLKKKLIKKEFNLMGDYLFCYNEGFKDAKNIKNLNYIKGLKYVLQGFKQSQNEIKGFIKKCKISENIDGYISDQFYDLKINSDYKFFSGPFTNSIFRILELQKNKIKVLMGKFETTVNKRELLFQPV